MLPWQPWTMFVMIAVWGHGRGDGEVGGLEGSEGEGGEGGE